MMSRKARADQFQPDLCLFSRGEGRPPRENQWKETHGFLVDVDVKKYGGCLFPRQSKLPFVATSKEPLNSLPLIPLPSHRSIGPTPPPPSRSLFGIPVCEAGEKKSKKINARYQTNDHKSLQLQLSDRHFLRKSNSGGGVGLMSLREIKNVYRWKPRPNMEKNNISAWTFCRC